GMVVKPTPRPALEMIQAQFLLHLLVALLHRPAALPEPHRLDPAGVRRQARAGILDLAVSPLLDQQPDRCGAATGALGPILARPDPDPGEVPRQLPLGPLAPGHLGTRQALAQRLQAHRAGVAFGQPGPRPGTAARRWPFGPIPARFRGEDHHLRGHPRDVDQLTLFQTVAE